MRRAGISILFFLLCFVSTGWQRAEAQTQEQAQARPRIITFDARERVPIRTKGPSLNKSATRA